MTKVLCIVRSSTVAQEIETQKKELIEFARTKGYDDDVTDLDTLDRMGRMNSDINGSPALKRAQIKASWAASDREDISNANKLSNQYEDNYYNDSNANTDPDASAWYSGSYNKNLKLGLKDWNKNGPNENKRYDGHKRHSYIG